MTIRTRFRKAVYELTASVCLKLAAREKIRYEPERHYINSHRFSFEFKDWNDVSRGALFIENGDALKIAIIGPPRNPAHSERNWQFTYGGGAPVEMRDSLLVEAPGQKTASVIYFIPEGNPLSEQTVKRNLLTRFWNKSGISPADLMTPQNLPDNEKVFRTLHTLVRASERMARVLPVIHALRLQP
jgi:hypothetical protein